MRGLWACWSSGLCVACAVLGFWFRIVMCGCLICGFVDLMVLIVGWGWGLMVLVGWICVKCRLFCSFCFGGCLVCLVLYDGGLVVWCGFRLVVVLCGLFVWLVVCFRDAWLGCLNLMWNYCVFDELLWVALWAFVWP